MKDQRKNNNPTGKGGAKKGEARNPGGIRKNTLKSANDFKDECFKLYFANQQKFHKAVFKDENMMIQFMKMLSGFVPKEVDLGNKDGEPLLVKWVQ